MLFAQAGHVEAWHWVAFGLFVAALLVLDLAVFNRRSREPTFRSSAIATAVWCSIALAFNLLLAIWRGGEIGLLFLTGYLVEWSLSMDNVFVFAVIFRFFGVPLKYQYRALFWGIIGAIMLRLGFILVGTALLARFEWILAILGLVLIYTGIKLAFESAEDFDPGQNRLMRLAKRFFPVTVEDHGQQFFAIENGRHAITPLFLVLLVIASTDLVFAVDSVPAIFGITDDPFTIATSNIFAVLGLRALYFLLAAVMGMFRYLNYGLSAVLIFVGAKMVVAFLLERQIPPLASLAVIVALLAISIIASLVADRRHPPE